MGQAPHRPIGQKGIAQPVADLVEFSCCAWQPIDTAPRDGTAVLLFSPAWDMFEVGVYDAAVRRWQQRTGDLIDSPTRWMPLPPPPHRPQAERPPEA